MCLCLTTGLSTVSGQETDNEALLERLQAGGLVIVFRHGPSNRGQADQLNLANAADLSAGQRQSQFLDCSRQRTLSDEGRTTLGQMASAVQSLDLAIEDVQASPMCRTRETAWLVFGRVTPNQALMSRQAADERQQIAGTVPTVGNNRVLVSHGQHVAAMVRAAENPSEEPVPEGGAFVLEPLGDSRYRVLARLLPEDWQMLADLAEATTGD